MLWGGGGTYFGDDVYHKFAPGAHSALVSRPRFFIGKDTVADIVSNKRTSLQSEEVIVRAVQFFSTAKWRATSQSPRAATFEGKIPIPWFMMLLTVLGFIFCLIPGFIMYFTLIRKLNRFQNLVVTATPQGSLTDVVLTYPKHARKLADAFLTAMPAAAPPLPP
jgi:hypothetical protein